MIVYTFQPTTFNLAELHVLNLQVVGLCFALICGCCTPTSTWTIQKQSDYTTNSGAGDQQVQK